VGGKASSMDTTLSILIDLIPLIVVAVFAAAALGDVAIRLRARQLHERPRHVPRHLHGSRA
jgi:hypothetical protein